MIGTGKTSLIKALANEYSIPIFTLDLNILQNNIDLQTLTDTINDYVSKNSRYILALEDVDRSKLFYNWTYRPTCATVKISKECFLNVIDGVVESHGRILIMTANDPEIITDFEALVRPGRIDKIVKIGYCTEKQLIRLVENFYAQSFPNEYDNFSLENEKITPAQVMKLLQNNPEDPEEFWTQFKQGIRPSNSSADASLTGNNSNNRRNYTYRRRYLTNKQRLRRVEQDLTILKKEQLKKQQERFQEELELNKLNHYTTDFHDLDQHTLSQIDIEKRKRKRKRKKSSKSKRTKTYHLRSLTTT